MPLPVGYPWRRLKNATANVISAPSRIKSKRVANEADKGIKAIKFLRQTKRVPADPKTKIGREKIMAMHNRDTAAKQLKKRKR
jgi:hypothetical protein